MPKIITSLNELRHSGRMCPEGWATLLRGLGKSQGDDEPLDVLTCLTHCGHHDTMWHFPNWPQHEDAYRSLAVSLAREVVHLTSDPTAAQLILDHGEARLRGELTWLGVWSAVPVSLKEYYHDGCTPEEAAMAAAVATAEPRGAILPYLVAKLAEEAEAKTEVRQRTTSHNRAEVRHAELLREFLSGN